MQSHHLRTQRTARYFVLGEPEGPWRELWFVLHGYGQLAGDLLGELEAAGLGDRLAGRLLVAPEGLSRFYLRSTQGRVGASWMTKEDRTHEIADYVAWLDALHAHLVRGRGPGRTCVLGFSQGAATAARWAVLGSARPARLVLWASGYPPDLEAALDGLAVDLVAGDGDELVPATRVVEEEERLRGLGASVTRHSFRGGHRLDAELLARLFEET